jgi:hypothetical protein
MTTKVIGVLAVVLVLFGGFKLFLYFERVKNARETEQKQAAAALVIGDQLEGLPQSLASSLQAAQTQGAAGLRNWLKTYGHAVQDPRKAWIELDYIVLLARESPAEARKLFAEVKQRTSPSSPVWPRIKQLQATFE